MEQSGQRSESTYPQGAQQPALSGSLHSVDIHPLREDIYNELHSRPFQVISSPSQMTHIAIQHKGKFKEKELALLTAICQRFQKTAPTTDMPCFYQDFGLFELRWERHMEFSGYTFIHCGHAGGEPFDRTALDYVPREWVDQLPGRVVAAFHLVIEQASSESDGDPAQVGRYFEGQTLVGSQLANGKALTWSAFRLHRDGFGRFLIYNRSLTDAQMGRHSQRLIELETYRLMGGLGLPLAKEIAPHIYTLDQQLKDATKRLASLDSANGERELLRTLSDMAAKIESFRARSNYRFSATSAYHQLVMHRVDILRELEVPGYLTLEEFLSRRLAPALRTCEAMGERLIDLSCRVDRASELLRTRVQLAIEEQNQQLLTSMNRRSEIQLRMQQTVEGLSVAAISYYLVGLMKIGYDALYELGLPFNKALVTGLTVPFVVGLVWWGTRRIHHYFARLDKASD